ncbi:hypothetical protein HOG17_02320 [Candidatus Peregrinibacteria bacterium]|jgi:hypothetical protein|nr:hypothetical protein [Candidatus Peregrinibacteria bacterium]MBT4366018.1 hypothetical protein [Candidatus Peregrinibacteria bacterium]MBT4456372.1 hypothetical protein [Candidatus Peregrinibacteria bacterium]
MEEFEKQEPRKEEAQSRLKSVRLVGKSQKAERVKVIESMEVERCVEKSCAQWFHSVDLMLSRIMGENIPDMDLTYKSVKSAIIEASVKIDFSDQEQVDSFFMDVHEYMLLFKESLEVYAMCQVRMPWKRRYVGFSPLIVAPAPMSTVGFSLGNYIFDKNESLPDSKDLMKFPLGEQLIPVSVVKSEIVKVMNSFKNSFGITISSIRRRSEFVAGVLSLVEERQEKITEKTFVTLLNKLVYLLYVAEYKGIEKGSGKGILKILARTIDNFS